VYILEIFVHGTEKQQSVTNAPQSQQIKFEYSAVSWTGRLSVVSDWRSEAGRRQLTKARAYV